ncbi:MAG: ATP-grasp domain-containing protein [Candidatus Hydrogenedentes bacterium]|nr:ATP-grasp domain-containing protein [Candidatus Hydrogenedentota bacterium]
MAVETTTEDIRRVLVFPCGSELGLALHRSLCFARFFEIHGASSVASNHGKYVFRRYHEGVPMVDAPDFAPRFAALVRELGIHYIYPANDAVALTLAEHERQWSGEVVGSPVETCRVCRSKRRTYAALAGCVRTPALYDDAAAPFPVFMKPDTGSASRGAQLVRDRDELALARRRHPDALVLEYLPGREYTVDCFTDRHGRLRFVGPRERLRIAGGISADTRPVEGAEFDAMARAIGERLVFRGAWFFQAKRDAAGQLALLEAAPRISGATGLYRNLGVNLPLLSLYDRAGFDVEIIPEHHDIEMDAALMNRFRTGLTYRHVYLDLDDTLLIRGEVNILAMAFVFQCRNRGVKVHLLTRHGGDVGRTLARHALTGCFDTVEHIINGRQKTEFITERDAIYIDDSFSERKRVHDARGIPVFDADAVESLLDWRM